MATTTAQRTGIWIIAIVLTIGTIAGFVAMIIAPGNQTADEQRLQAIQAKWQKEYTANQKAMEAQQAQLEKEKTTLSKEYFTTFKSYQDKYVEKFDKAQAQKKLVTKDLRQGTGAAIDDNTTFAAYYVLWMPDGKATEGSIDGVQLSTPLIARPGKVITGWTQGLKGMKMGGARLLIIPSEQAYGSEGKGDIPANMPLAFIVMPIKILPTLTEPEIPEELLTGAVY